MVVEYRLCPPRACRRIGRESKIRIIFGCGAQVATQDLSVSIILVFLPLMTLRRHMEGKMFALLAYTIAIALGRVLCSSSLTLTPGAVVLSAEGGGDDTG